MNHKIGILAFGSLIQDPGKEIEPLIIDRLLCLTPFKIEFGRVSSTRGNAPTLIPVKIGGSNVKATILILDDQINLQAAIDMLWRRETRTSDLTKSYIPKKHNNNNTVEVKKVENFEGIEQVIYTSIGSNIDEISPQKLADYAIQSILSPAGALHLDGVRYLKNVIKNGIITPLTKDFEKCILNYTHTDNIDDAISFLDQQRNDRQ